MTSMFGPNKYGQEPDPVDDTGWITVTLTDTTNFALYAGQPIRIRKIGQVAYLTGALNLQTATYIDGTTSRTFATFPVEYAPSAPALPVFACQGTSTNRWALRVFSDGRLGAERYGPGASVVGAWLPFNPTWAIG